jgi:hypothetical protein
METFTDEIIRGLLSRSLEQAVIDSEGWHDRGAGPGSDAGEFIDWLTIRDAHASVVTDVRRIRTHPPVPPTIPIYGYLYDVLACHTVILASGASAECCIVLSWSAKYASIHGNAHCPSTTRS